METVTMNNSLTEKLNRRIIIVTGHYGSGKTNVSANIAVQLSKSGQKVTVVDLDIVNPYFRSADFTELFGSHNIELVKSIYANTNLDIPAISFDLERIVSENGFIVIDVGGDDDGAVALGRYTEALEQFADNIEFLYVVNARRYLTREPIEALELLCAIENTAKMKATAIVNNTNLGRETIPSVIMEGLAYADVISKKSGLPIAFTTAPGNIQCKELDNVAKYVDIYVKKIWE